MNRNWPYKIILVLCLLIPFAFSTVTADKFGTPKVTIFLFGCSLLGFYLLIYGRSLLQLPRLIVYSIVLFIVFQILQTFRLSNPLNGLFGEYGQSESLLVQVGFIIFLLAGYLFINDDSKRSKFQQLFLIAVFLVSIFGVTEYYIGNPITLIHVTRIKSFFGDPNSLGAFLLLTLPLIIAQFWSQPNWRLKWIIGGILYLGIIALYLTFSRSAWLAFLGMSLPVILWGVSRKIFPDRILRINLLLTSFILILGLLSGIILNYFQPREHNDYNLTARVSSVAQGNDSGRSLLWSTALETFKHSPWIGYGTGSFIINFHRYASKQVVLFWQLERDISQVHNEFLQYLATQGLLGISIFLFLLFTLLWYGGLLNLIQRNLNLDQIAYWAAIISYLCFILFAYSLVHYTFLFWIYGGILIAYRYPYPPNLKPNYRSSWIVIVIACLAIGSWGWLLGRFYVADIHYKKALHYGRKFQYHESLVNCRKAITLAPFEYQFQYQYALTLFKNAEYLKRMKSNPASINDYQRKARNYTLQLLTHNPNRYQLYFLLGQIAEAEQNFHDARYNYRKAIIFYPNNYQLKFRLTKIELLLGNKLAAYQAYQSGVEINPVYMEKMLRLEGLSLKSFY